MAYEAFQQGNAAGRRPVAVRAADPHGADAGFGGVSCRNEDGHVHAPAWLWQGLLLIALAIAAGRPAPCLSAELTEDKLREVPLYFWMHEDGCTEWEDKFGEKTLDGLAPACRVVAIRHFDEERPDGTRSSQLFVLPLPGPEVTDVKRYCTTYASDKKPGGEYNLIDCIKVLACGEKPPLDREGCGYLHANHFIRQRLNAIAENKQSKRGNYASFLLQELRERERNGHNGDWVSIQRALGEPTDLPVEARERNLRAIQLFLSGVDSGNVSDESLNKAGEQKDALAADLTDAGFDAASADIKGRWELLREKATDPVYAFGWISKAVLRDKGARGATRSQADSFDPAAKVEYLTYYRLRLWNKEKDEWDSALTALAPEPADDCLGRTSRWTLDLKNLGQTAELRRCLERTAALIESEDLQQDRMDETLLNIARRTVHWSFPSPDNPREGGPKPYFNPLIRPSCTEAASADFRQSGYQCCNWRFLLGWLDGENWKACDEQPAGDSQEWKKDLAYDGHAKHPIFEDWFGEKSRLEWWRSVKEEIGRKRQPGERFVDNAAACVFYIQDEADCVPPLFYLAPVLGFVFLYMLYRLKRGNGSGP